MDVFTSEKCEKNFQLLQTKRLSMLLLKLQLQSYFIRSKGNQALVETRGQNEKVTSYCYWKKPNIFSLLRFYGFHEFPVFLSFLDHLS